MGEFPKGFLWGAATSAHQVEGNNSNSDWWEWERRGQVKEPSGNACRHYELFKEDFALAKFLNHNAHRLSVEWARIEPQEGCFLEKELNHYKEVIRYLKERNIEPLVTLHHFTNPLWFGKKRGWLNKNSVNYFLRYAQKVIEALADEVRFWVTINEPTIYVYYSYFVGSWPPQEKSLYKGWRVTNNFLKAHIKLHRFTHSYYRQRQLDCPFVGMANNLQFYQPSPDTFRNRFAAFLRNRLLNLNLINKVARKKSCDYIGLNYYSRSLVDAKNWLPASLLSDTGTDSSLEVKKNSLGWDVYPEGLYRILMDLKRYNLPVLILENGICTEDDNLRWEFIRGHLESVGRALKEGVNIIGYLYWALIDNFEWDKGFAPRFGLIGVDYDTYQRTVRQSAENYAQVCKNSRLI